MLNINVIEDPLRDYLGIKVVEVGEFLAIVEGVVKKEYLNKMKTAHGGYLATLIDSAMGVAANWDGKLRFAIQLSVNFLKPAFEGDKLIAKAKKVGGGKRIVFLEIEVYRENEVIAKGSGIVYCRS